MNIDWDNFRLQIIKSYRLSDSEIEICLKSFDEALKLYENSTSVPERINLTDEYGQVLHTIIIKNGLPNTIDIKPNRSPLSYKLLLPISALAMIGFFVYYYS